MVDARGVPLSIVVTGANRHDVTRLVATLDASLGLPLHHAPGITCAPTPREFIDGLALGQFTPGPILMVAAYVGYKVAGLAGAIVGAAEIFLLSFILMLSILPVFERVRKLVRTRAAMKGIGPAVIGSLAVSPATCAACATRFVCNVILAATIVALLVWRVGTVKLMIGGSLAGILHTRLLSLATRATL